MEQKKTAVEINAELAKPFAPEDLEWRLQRTFESRGDTMGLAVPYVTNRAIQSRLDEVVGPDNWYNDYKPWHRFTVKVKSEKDPQKYFDKEVISQLCGIAIFFEESQRWITKWDGAENTDIEPVKGGLSDSMKRAAVQWGIGRVLYNMDGVFVDVEKRGRTWCIAKKEQSKLDKAYLDMLKALGQTPAKPIGTQAQLTPDAPAEQPAPTPKSQKAPKPKAASDKDAKASENGEAKYEYKVVGVKEQPGMNSTNTRLALESPEGKQVSAFARGKRPDLTVGTLLTGTKLATRKQDTVVFYILEDYQVVSLQQAA